MTDHIWYKHMSATPDYQPALKREIKLKPEVEAELRQDKLPGIIRRAGAVVSPPIWLDESTVAVINRAVKNNEIHISQRQIRPIVADGVEVWELWIRFGNQNAEWQRLTVQTYSQSDARVWLKYGTRTDVWTGVAADHQLDATRQGIRAIIMAQERARMSVVDPRNIVRPIGI